jgi:hypothetical protein
MSIKCIKKNKKKTIQRCLYYESVCYFVRFSNFMIVFKKFHIYSETYWIHIQITQSAVTSVYLNAGLFSFDEINYLIKLDNLSHSFYSLLDFDLILVSCRDKTFSWFVECLSFLQLLSKTFYFEQTSYYF